MSQTPSILSGHVATLVLKDVSFDGSTSVIFPNVTVLVLHNSYVVSGLVQPSLIETLRLHIDMDVLPRIIESNINQMHNLQRLTLSLSSRVTEQHELFLRTDFSKLQMLRLRFFHFDLQLPRCISEHASLDALIPPSLINFIRTQPLECMSIFDKHRPTLLISDFIRRIAQQPHNLSKLRLLELHVYYTQPILESLGLLPSIEKFCRLPYYGETPDLPVDQYHLIAKFCNLTHLDLAGPASHPITAANAVLMVQHLPQLTYLKLAEICRTLELNEILAALPRLTSLSLRQCPITELSFVRNHGLPQRLKSLCLRECGPIPHVELERLFLLQQLTDLRLVDVFDEPLDDVLRSKSNLAQPLVGSSKEKDAQDCGEICRTICN